MWGEVIRYAEAVSTNDLARDHARRGAAEGTVVLARHQTQGRGRRGRSWEAPPGKALLASVVLRPPMFVSHSAWLTLGAGVAAARALGERTGQPVRLKWPNDLTIDGRKVGGVLAETFRGDDGPLCVVGIGINLNQTEQDFPPDLREGATSLLRKTGQEWPLEPVLDSLTSHLRGVYQTLVRGDLEDLRNAWQSLDETVGQHVVVDSPEGAWEGKATGIDDQGGLWIEEAGGDPRRVTVGDVTIRFGG
jgi:BirA family biotin operon repressor/biotin-[acetyl-CoA-carboxylase] ligase